MQVEDGTIETSQHPPQGAPSHQLGKAVVTACLPAPVGEGGVGGPVGSGKTAIVEAITPRLLELGIKVLIITNDVVTTEDAKHVRRVLQGVLLEERIIGVETGVVAHCSSRSW